jgi:hypothetical protein
VPRIDTHAVFNVLLQFRYAINGRVIENAFQDGPVNTVSAFKSGDLAGHAIFSLRFTHRCGYLSFRNIQAATMK